MPSLTCAVEVGLGRRVIEEECEARGISPVGLPEEVGAAMEWAARTVAERGVLQECHRCSQHTTAYLRCMECCLNFCRPCLGLERGELWDISFSCPGCMIESREWPAAKSAEMEYEMELSRSTLQSLGASLKPSTWLRYHRHVGEFLEWCQNRGNMCFPVATVRDAWGLARFMEYLRRDKGCSWAYICHYRDAIKSVCRARGLTDQWEAFPFLHDIGVGIRKRSARTTVRKEGASVAMITALLKFWEQSETRYRANGQHELADTVLRHQVSVILGYFGMKRKSEIFLAADGRLGLRVGHVALVQGSHVRLHVAAQKNDPYNHGDEIPLAWETKSGVKIGATVQRYLRRLYESGVQVSDPLICKTGWERGLYTGFKAQPKGVCFMPDDCFRKGLKECFVELAMPQYEHILKRYAWHSLRRGGAINAFNNGGGMKGVCAIGLWESEAGAAPYALASFDTKLKCSELM